MKIAVLLRSARSALRSEARDLFLIAPQRSNSERAAPSACVGKRFRLLRLFGIDRLARSRWGAGRRPRWLRILTITGGSSIGGDDLQSAAAVRAVFDVDVEDPFEQPGPAHACRRARDRNFKSPFF